MLGTVSYNGVIMQFIQQRAVHFLKLVISEVFTVQCANVWRKICQISCLCYVSLSHVFDNHIKILHREYRPICQISEFLFSLISLSASAPKTPFGFLMLTSFRSKFTTKSAQCNVHNIHPGNSEARTSTVNVDAENKICH